MSQDASRDLSRRDFLKDGSVLSAAALLPSLGRLPGPLVGSDTIRLGVIGCGGRGSGAVHNCISSSEGVQLVAIGDLFPDRLQGSRKRLAKNGPKFQVKDELCFSGFDAYKKVLALDLDLVILATPPAFRPIHFEAAIAAGKNVFMEKPVAVCPAGIRKVIAGAKAAKEKKLAVVAGTQRRHQASYLETIGRIHDGAIGDVVSAHCYWNQGGLWKKDRKPEFSDIEWQLRNWLYFTWASGDHIVEQHVHNLDVCNWVIGRTPKRAYGMGGRQVRIDPAYGQIFDHFAIEYDYGDGVKVTSMCRQIGGTANRVGEEVYGTKGHSAPGGWIKGETQYHYKSKKRVNPYVQEHADLIASIRSGEPLNEGVRVAESTLTAIMGRMSAYTGKIVGWDFAMNESKLNLLPGFEDFGPKPVDPVPMPGLTQLV